MGFEKQVIAHEWMSDMNKKGRNPFWTIHDGDITHVLVHGDWFCMDFDCWTRLNSISCWSVQIRTTGHVTLRIGEKRESLHRWIINAVSMDDTVDHINRNPRDNRKLNLRTGSFSENAANRLGLNKYKGVSWRTRDQKWRACIEKNGKHIHIGMFHCPIAAANAYDSKAFEIFGEFAVLNFPKGVE